MQAFVCKNLESQANCTTFTANTYSKHKWMNCICGKWSQDTSLVLPNTTIAKRPQKMEKHVLLISVPLVWGSW